MSKRILKPNSGVTLLEISFAMGILVISISMLFGALINMQRSGQTVQSKSSANMVLRSFTESIRGMEVYDVLGTEFVDIVWDGITYSVLIEIKDKDGNMTALPITESSGEGEVQEVSIDLNDYPNPIETKVTLTWVALPQYDSNGELVGGRAMQLTTRTLLEGEGPVVIPTPSS